MELSYSYCSVSIISHGKKIDPEVSGAISKISGTFSLFRKVESFRDRTEHTAAVKSRSGLDDLEFRSSMADVFFFFNFLTVINNPGSFLAALWRSRIVCKN